MEITPKLGLNKHPKDNINMSFVNAQNMMINHDESSITNEVSIRENIFIHNYLSNYYGEELEYKIVGIIACNNELVIIVKPDSEEFDSDIFRYREAINTNIESMYCAYGGLISDNRFKYQGGDIKGVFTYNVENSLIIAITEYGVDNVKIPLRIINLGNYDDDTIYNDKDLSNSKLPINPEVKLPSINDLDYIPGGAYKGWYYIFIRFKINSVDYTQWHSIGTPIYVDSLEQYQLVRYCFNRDPKAGNTPLAILVSPNMPDDGYGAGCSDYFSNTSDISKETFKFNLSFDIDTKYDRYQIGMICSSKSYIKAFRTSDIFLNRHYTDVDNNRIQQYVFDNKSLIDYNTLDLITDNFNYFNTENIFNYQNKLYISNYLEDTANDKTINQSIIDDINVNIIKNEIKDYGLLYDTALISEDKTNVNQYDTYTRNTIFLSDYLKVSKDTIITISAPDYPTKTAKADQFYITTGALNPGFIYIELREPSFPTNTITKYGIEPNQRDVSLSMSDINNNETINIIINTAEIAIDGGMQYTNTKTSFKERKRESSLIPGEIYNLFIHFTDEYGASTNGYKLTNNTIWNTEDALDNEIIPIPFTINFGLDDLIYYAAMDVNENIINEDNSEDVPKYNINTNNIKFYRNFIDTKLTDKVTSLQEAQCLETFINNFLSYTTIKYLDTKWYQVSYGPGEDNFHLFINNNEDRLFKVPVVKSFEQKYDGFVDIIHNYKSYNSHTTLKINVSNVEIPVGYIGYYISYEKFEPQRRATGLLTRSDFRSQDYITFVDILGTTINTNLQTANDKKADKMYFYSSIYDVSDSIKLDYNLIRIEGINVFKKQDIAEWNHFQRNQAYGYDHDMNKPQVDEYGVGVQKTYAMPDYKIVVANSAVDNRMGLGTALQIDDSYNLFPNYNVTDSDHDRIKLYRVTIANTTRDIYMSNSKTLIKLTDIIYRDVEQPVDYKYNKDIVSGYNGHYTYDGIIIYENAGLIFNTTTNKATTFVTNRDYYKTSVPDEKPYSFQNDYPFLAYLQLPICMDTFLESKSFKNAPAGIVYTVKTGEVSTFFKGNMITPSNSIDVFENRQSTADDFNPKTYTNYREDLVSIERFDKTIRRSNVIQDESRVNGWRTFSIEAYKIIAENKGKITNLLGIGYMFLIHTEHSLFMLNRDNNLKTQDKDVKLLQPDAFDVDYQEVFTSDKGFGGLQDGKSYLLDTFGYIFHSEDTNRIYLFDNGQLAYIDDDIIEWLYKYKPFNVRMANDKKNYRILIKFDYVVFGVTKHTVISYNYKTKAFVSQHGYYFDEAFNTKTNLYMQCINEHIGCSLHSFIKDHSSYGSYDNVLGSLGTIVIKDSKISIIVNSNYKDIKFLEYITYKLTKYVNDINIDFTNSTVEEYIVPFAGNKLSIYNDIINTGLLDINVNDEIAKNVFGNFDKPYWDLGVWNFSYLRNRVSELNTGVVDDNMSRLYGNYFICEFTFNNTDAKRIAFEELTYNISEV